MASAFLRLRHAARLTVVAKNLRSGVARVHGVDVDDSCRAARAQEGQGGTAAPDLGEVAELD
jgi:hypothetical protein